MTLTNVSASSKSSPNLVRCFVVDNEATLKIDSVEDDEQRQFPHTATILDKCGKLLPWWPKNFESDHEN